MKNSSHPVQSAHRRRFFRALSRSLLFVAALSAVLALWTAAAEAHAHYMPEYSQVDLLPLLQKRLLTKSEYEVLFRQTGLARAGVDALYASGCQDELLYLQQRFFARAKVECCCDNLFVRSERLLDFEPVVQRAGGKVNGAYDLPGSDDGTGAVCDFLPTAQDGDILITLSTHIFGWRSGHAAIVVDAGRRLTLEAIMPGYDSQICSLDDWQQYPGFALLRLKNASAEEREQVAAYAQSNLAGIPYRLAAFAAPQDAALSLAGTQCAHLVWYAYSRFGYDLDSDGGFVVTPDDLYRSDLLELVQIYGLEPNY